MGWGEVCSNLVLVSGAVVVCFAVEAVVLGVTIFLSVETGAVVFVYVVVKFFACPLVDDVPVVVGVVEGTVTAVEETRKKITQNNQDTIYIIEC